MLVGRDAEQARIDRLLADARAGVGGALVIRGEAGIGKSTLLEYASSAAQQMLVIRGVGVESEAELPFGALHQLLYPYLDRLDLLPVPQRAALRSAFGLSDTPVTNRFLVGAATLTLLAELATETPTLLLLDDAQWLDQSSSDALLFAARRFHADRITALFGVREGELLFPAPGIDVLRLSSLPRAPAGALLDVHAPGLAAPVRERVLAEAAGNPLAVIELGAARAAADRAEHADPVEQVGPLSVTRRVQDIFRDQIAGLAVETRSLLLIAAADGDADLDTMLRVAAALGLSAADFEPAERARLVTVSGDRVAFRHPLIRAAAYQDAPLHRRIAVHEAFAQVLTRSENSDRRAWHLAATTTGPDEAVAAELERTAMRAQRRGGAMAVSAAYERAARLSADLERRARRLAKAAYAAYDAGKPDRAERLAAEAAALTGDAGVAAEATLIRARVAYERTSPAADAALALEAAALIVGADPERAMFMLTEVVGAGRDACAHDLIQEGVRLLRSLRLPANSELALAAAAQIGWGDLFAGRPEPAVAPMAALLEAARGGTIDHLFRIVAGFSGSMLARDEETIAVMSAMVADARESGALLWIPYALEVLALGQLLNGELLAAQASVAEGVSTATELGMATEVLALKAIEAWLAAASGDEARCWELAGAVRSQPMRHPTNAALASWGVGLLHLAAGDADAALDVLDGVCAGPARRDFLIRAVPDQVEAAVRSGRPERAREHLPAFDHWARSVGSPLASALALRCHALLDPGDGAGERFTAALRIQHRHGGPFDLARTRLLYGEWLRRRRRRQDAGAQLAAAMEAFEQLGAARWAQRTGAELAALGERWVTRPREPDLLKRLTPQEVQVVRLAAAGHSNKEIGAQLFLSPRTVGHHLYKAYPKLGVTRRTGLAHLKL